MYMSFFIYIYRYISFDVFALCFPFSEYALIFTHNKPVK